ncbi:MAG: two-component sensor histidine kinase, partial [Rhodospirillales bacterium]|nr:two-component sensor histidine kinase [Rhodospirillales bacterium]
LSVVVAAVASFAALTLAARARSGLTHRRGLWLFAAALALGGGIWTMHFVGMLAFELPLAVAYDPFATVASMLIAVVVVASGIWLVDRAEGNWRAWFVAGPIVGIGVALMHYTGMYAMRMQAVTRYDTFLFILSIVIAIVAATAALAIAFTVRAIWLRCIAACVMAAAIAGMHYTGMAAAQFLPDASIAETPVGADRFWLATAIGVVFLVCSFLAMLSVWIEHRLAQREAATVRRSERRLRAMLQHATDVVLLLDRDGRVQFESGPVEALLGVPAGALLGRHVIDVVRGAPALDVLCKNMETDAGTVRRLDISVTPATGMPVILEATVQDAFHEPELGARLVQLHDVTEARLAVERLAAARDAAQRGDRAKSEFLGSISHELRTPIHVALGFSGMLRDNAERIDAAQVAEFAGEIHSSIDRLMQIVGDLIELSRLEGDDPMDEDLIDPRSLLQGATRRLQATATRARLTFEIVTDATPRPMLADERKLAYALWHLIGNAIKFSDSGDTIRLVAGLEPDGGVRLTVQDSGIGMSADEMARATERFTQADGSHRRNAEGLGLGLSLARRIAELHGGRLELESSEGAGTRASIVLPATRTRPHIAAA